ncbi:MAG: hypothetical protein OXF01_12830 [Gemmatimonadetes bacterium]|nr:hypothetical protein [Gemmatimonadota bacterium]
MELWQFISLVVTTISVAIAGTWRVSSLLNAQRIETRDLLAELRRDNQRAHDEIGKRIEAQGERLSERIDAQGRRIETQGEKLSERIDAHGRRIETHRQELADRIIAVRQELGDRIDAARQELGDRIGALAVQVARLVGREEGRDPP